MLRDRFLKKMLLKKSKHPSPFLNKTIGLNNSFTLIENKFRFFRIPYIEFNLNIAYGKMHPVETPQRPILGLCPLGIMKNMSEFLEGYQIVVIVF